MTRLVVTKGQCCPFCPFLCFLCDILSSHPVRMNEGRHIERVSLAIVSVFLFCSRGDVYEVAAMASRSLDHIDIFGSVGRLRSGGRPAGRGSPHLTPITTEPTSVPGQIISRCTWHFQTSRPSVKMPQYLQGARLHSDDVTSLFPSTRLRSRPAS